MIQKKFPLSSILNDNHTIAGYKFMHFKLLPYQHRNRKYKSVHPGEGGRVSIRRFDKIIRNTFRKPEEVVMCYYEKDASAKTQNRHMEDRTDEERVKFLESLFPQQKHSLAYIMKGILP